MNYTLYTAINSLYKLVRWSKEIMQIILVWNKRIWYAGEEISLRDDKNSKHMGNSNDITKSDR